MSMVALKLGKQKYDLVFGVTVILFQKKNIKIAAVLIVQKLITFNKGKNMSGIDYGNGLTNINLDTRIRFGVIPINAVTQAWCDSSSPFYPNCCPLCGNEPKTGNKIHEMKRCPSCHKSLSDFDFENTDSNGNILDDGEYKAIDDEYGDIFITLSPYYTYASFCSPCAPGACYLPSPLTEKVKNNRAYCFGHDFFEDGKAPYTVYSVETDKEINP